MGLSKTFAVTESVKLQLRGEFFNIFNRVNFLSDEGTVNNFSTISNSTFGTLRTAADPRIGQLALKIASQDLLDAGIAVRLHSVQALFTDESRTSSADHVRVPASALTGDSCSLQLCWTWSVAPP